MGNLSSSLYTALDRKHPQRTVKATTAFNRNPLERRDQRPAAAKYGTLALGDDLVIVLYKNRVNKK